MEIKPVVQIGLTDLDDERFDLVRNNIFTDEQIKSGIGKLISRSLSGLCVSDAADVYQSYFDEKIGYKLYTQHKLYPPIHFKDAVMIEELEKRKGNISLSKFPMGVITLDRKVIGQEMPFFDGYENLLIAFKKKDPNISPVQIYKQMLIIIRELFTNGIDYEDFHGKNFMVNVTDRSKPIEIIDFHPDYVTFSDSPIELNAEMSYLFYEAVIGLSKTYGISEDIIKKFRAHLSFDGYFGELNKMQESIKSRG